MKFELFLAAAALAFTALTAQAGPFGLPDHQPDGWRDTGCTEAANVDKGGYLNNPTCPNGQGGMEADHGAYPRPEIDPDVEPAT